MLRDVLINQKGLSNREAEVAELVTKGLSNKEVANQLFVTEKTVKFHLTNIYKKMSLKSRAQLIVWCMPHFSFQEAPQVQGNAIAGNANNNGTENSQGSLPQNTIPSGSSTVTSIRGGTNGQGNGNGFGF
jgi:DNA-binding CsgD family transcriptional regulator